MMEHSGKKLVIRYCEAGVDVALETGEKVKVPASWIEALGNIVKSKHDSIRAKMTARRNFLADGGQLRSPDHWNTEGELPDKKRFYAIKADKVRAYGWFSTRHPGVFYISHFAFKRGQKLAPEDTNRVVANWRRIEEKPR